MLFSSISFLYYFLPVFLLVYLCIPWKCKNLVLLVFSLVFYFIGEPIYILILLFSSAADFFHGLLLDRIPCKSPLAKAVLTSSIVINVGLLTVFKYSGFFIDNVNKFFDTGIADPALALPLGISFYTFQTMSYTIDVYRGRVKAQKSFLNFATYVCMFPQLVAGPVVRYSSVEHQLSNRSVSFDYFSQGVSRFIMGLAKKVLIANTLGELSTTVYGLCEGPHPSVILYWLGAFSFALQIYFDFSGYSDMAIGLGKMLGFDFPENFNYPFIARSVTDFWRRWHMTLGGWFKDYVYFPLGGSRVSSLKWIRNLTVVWALTGFWHGAEWNFIIWGLYFALFLALEKLLLANWLKSAPAFAAHFYTLFVLIFSFVIFNTTDISILLQRLGGMFGLGEIPLSSDITVYYVKSYFVIIMISIIAATPLSVKVLEKIKDFSRQTENMEKAVVGRAANRRTEVMAAVGRAVNIAMAVAVPLFYAGLLLLSTAYIVDSSFNPFLYFRF